MIHNLKTWPKFFELVWNGRKTFEYRQNDRDYQIQDTLCLQEYDPATDVYSGREIEAAVMLVVDEAPGLPDGYCVMQLGNFERRESSLHDWEVLPAAF